jgi:hypothetical protein
MTRQTFTTVNCVQVLNRKTSVIEKTFIGEGRATKARDWIELHNRLDKEREIDRTNVNIWSNLRSSINRISGWNNSNTN